MTAILVGSNASADSCFQKASPVEAIAFSPKTDSDTPPKAGDGRRSQIPDNLDQLKLAQLKAIARQFDLMTHVVESGPLNQKASYIKTLEAYRHQHQYEAATASSSECDRFFASDVNDYPESVELADRLHSSNEPILMRAEDEPSELQAIESTGEFRCTVGDCTIREVAGIAYLDTPSGSYQFKAGLGECAIALSTTPETLSQIIAHLQKFNGRTSFLTTFAQAVFAIEQQSQPPTPMMDWAQKLNQAFAGASVIGSRDRHISHTHNISSHSSKCCHGQSTKNATFSLELLPRTPQRFKRASPTQMAQLAKIFYPIRELFLALTRLAHETIRVSIKLAHWHIKISSLAQCLHRKSL
ncbi:hypothetical protein [Phormidium nigroviride]